MAGDRYVVLGLAHARSRWFGELAQWAQAAIVPLELVKCIAVEELRARVASGRVFSAAVLDGSLAAVDRDLIAATRDAGCAVFVVDHDRRERDWIVLGASAVLAADFGPEALLDALDAHATIISRSEATRTRAGRDRADLPVVEAGRVVAV